MLEHGPKRPIRADSGQIRRAESRCERFSGQPACPRSRQRLLRTPIVSRPRAIPNARPQAAHCFGMRPRAPTVKRWPQRRNSSWTGRHGCGSSTGRQRRASLMASVSACLHLRAGASTVARFGISAMGTSWLQPAGRCGHLTACYAGTESCSDPVGSFPGRRAAAPAARATCCATRSPSTQACRAAARSWTLSGLRASPRRS